MPKDEHFERTMLRTSPALGAMSRKGDKISSFVFDLMNLAPSERQKAARRRPYQSLVLAVLPGALRRTPLPLRRCPVGGPGQVADEIEAQLGPWHEEKE
jgi:hypothetical protein